jgi:Methyltransferase domain
MPRFIPRRYKPRNVGEWTGHLGFASDLIVATQPALIVELGTHWGESYFTFCQTVQEHGLSCICYAVDHWLGDEHAGRYGEEVFEDVGRYNGRYYRQFSYLLRTSFDEAVSQFGDGSIDLLHIDGLHTYDAVSHDFRTWLPKVRQGGIVLLHDICPKHQDFGVWRLWDEIKAEFPSTFEFHHSWGLGVVRKGGAATNSVLTELLFSGTPSVHEEIRHRYVVYASHLEHLLGHLAPGVAAHKSPLKPSSEIRVKVFPFGPAGHCEDTALIHKAIAGEWNTLTFELPEGNGNGPIRVDPEHQPCLVEVGDILIHSASGELLWSDSASAEARSFAAEGSVAVLPIGNGSIMTSFGDDPLLLLPPRNLQGRLKLTISLRVSLAPNPAPEIVYSVIKDVRATAEDQVSAAQLERETLANQLGQANAELAKVTAAHSGAQQGLMRTQELLLAAEDQLRRMQDSLSWKVTEPIRRLMTAVRSGPRKTS